jgi:membrane-bound lytic murein transglycosylase
MKTERVTLLTSPDFKAFLNAEAHREGVSVAELVRTRCERRPSDEEAMLAELTRELQQSMVVAKRALKNGLDEAQAALKELSLQRRDAASGRSKSKATSRHSELITLPKGAAKRIAVEATKQPPKQATKHAPKRAGVRA